MDQNTIAIVVALIGMVGVVATAIVSYRQGQLKVTQDLQIEYDKDLRARRINSYTELWKYMRPLAKYPVPESLSYDQVGSLALSFTQWYFSGGGLFLSALARDHYFDLQDGMKIILQNYAREWPFHGDGLTNAALQQYLERAEAWVCPPALMEIAKAAIDTTSTTVPTSVLAQLRKLGSALRTSLTSDVMTRQATVLRPGER
jgi:hypothetical protein